MICEMLTLSTGQCQNQAVWVWTPKADLTIELALCDDCGRAMARDDAGS